jgi:hypothetical protein
MSLQLNEPTLDYEEFYGGNTTEMPKLVAEGRTPMSVAGLMQRRLEVLGASRRVRRAWLNNYFDTGDAVLYHPNGKVKIVLDAQPLRTLNKKSKLRNGALIIDNDTYRSLSGEEFNRENLVTDTPLSKKQVLKSPVWNALARGDTKLLREYTDAAFADAKRRFDYTENMGVFLGQPQESPVLRAWFVNRFNGRSDLYGNLDLDINDGRLVGVAPETQSCANNGASYARAHRQDEDPRRYLI